MIHIISGRPFSVDLISLRAYAFQIGRIALMVWILFWPERGACFFSRRLFLWGIIAFSYRNATSNMHLVKFIEMQHCNSSTDTVNKQCMACERKTYKLVCIDTLIY